MRIERHENSQSDRIASTAMFNRSDAKNLVDNLLLEKKKAEVAYSSAVLERILAVIKHLAALFPFRGHDELFGSVDNGNYYGTLKLLAQFDPLMDLKVRDQCHFSPLQFVMNRSRSWARKCKETKYFSITVDSTPNISHIDKLSCILRCVLEDGPGERFLQFLDMKGHTLKEMPNSVLGFFKENGINIENCRGQLYDNESIMSGEYGSLQALIREKDEHVD